MEPEAPGKKQKEEALEVLDKVHVDWKDHESALKAVAENGLLLSRAPLELRNDRELVLTAVGHRGLALHYASEALRGDREVVEVAVSETGVALEFAATHLRRCAATVLKAVAQNGAALEYAAQELREDRDFVLKAVEHSARALACAADFLLADPTFIAEAVKRNSWTLGYAPKKLQKDREMVLDRWHPPPKPDDPPPSQSLPGLHMTHLPRPPWQGDPPHKRRPGPRPREKLGSPQELEATTELRPFPGTALPPELEKARQEAAKQAGITRDLGRRKGDDLARREGMTTRFCSTLPLELELARQAVCRETLSPRVRPQLPAELEMARQAAFKKGVALTARW